MTGWLSYETYHGYGLQGRCVIAICSYRREAWLYGTPRSDPHGRQSRQFRLSDAFECVADAGAAGFIFLISDRPFKEVGR